MPYTIEASPLPLARVYVGAYMRAENRGGVGGCKTGVPQRGLALGEALWGTPVALGLRGLSEKGGDHPYGLLLLVEEGGDQVARSDVTSLVG